MTFLRKLALATAAISLGATLAGTAAPASAGYDSGWGCGGNCRTVPPSQP